MPLPHASHGPAVAPQRLWLPRFGEELPSLQFRQQLRHPRNYRFSGFRKAGYMARLPLMVLPGIPHHVTQRGYRRERTFFEDADYALYLDLLAEAADRHGIESWS